MLRTTPFHARTAPLVQGWAYRRWAGYAVASAYELSHEREYHAIRASAALFDISPLRKYEVRGRDAARLLDRVVTRDVRALPPARVLYTPWCDGAGQVLDDGTIARRDETVFRMTCSEPNLRWLGENARGLEVEIEDVSERLAALALQGPASRAILEAACDASLGALGYFGLGRARLGGVGVEISRTGYTGDLGYEIWVEAESALAVWDALVDAGRAHALVPAGLLALDLARLEAGLLLIDVDYVPARKALVPGQASSPFELGLGWAVKLEKDFFVGKRALEAEVRRDPSSRLAGLELEWEPLERLWSARGLAVRLPATVERTSVPVYAGGRQVGYATTHGWSPLLKRYLALAHLAARWAEPGTRVEMEVTVEHRRERCPARVVKKPFYDPPRKRA